jgi:hypothetical protein
MPLIDHQLGTMSWTHSHDINLVKQNAIKLAKIGKAVSIPTVLTSSMEDKVQGPLTGNGRRIGFVHKVRSIGWSGNGTKPKCS